MDHSRLRIHNLVALLVVLGFGGVSIAKYRSTQSDVRKQSIELLRNALADLQSPAKEPSEIIGNYVSRLNDADSALRAFLTVNPLDTFSIQQLAAVRWESGVLRDGANQPPVMALVELAAARAPRDPNTHIALAALLFKLGDSKRACNIAARAVELSHSYARKAVDLMIANGVSAREITTSLPRTPEVLLSTAEVFHAALLDSELMPMVEQLLDSAPMQLVPLYSDLSLATANARRLADRMSLPFPGEMPLLKSLRLAEQARALLALGELRKALAGVSEINSSVDVNMLILEITGDVALAARDSKSATFAFRRSLALAAEQTEPSCALARLYRKVGQAAEVGNQPEVAYDAYKRALALCNHEHPASLRIAAMEAAAGTRALLPATRQLEETR
jgi:tetratricopeptide (TPR) repeat protein